MLFFFFIREEKFEYEIFNFQEKKDFVKTLLIVTGILFALNISESIYDYFFVFIIGSLLYFIVVSWYLNNPKSKLLRIFIYGFALLIGYSFSILLFNLTYVIDDITDLIVLSAVALLISMILSFGDIEDE